MTSSRFFVAAALMCSGFLSTDRQDHPNQSPTVLRAEVTARTIDVIVRDKKGRPVTGLGVGDFALREDGVSQRVLDVTAVVPPIAVISPKDQNVQADPKARAAAALPAGRTPQHASPSALAIVFERLSPESRGAARDAALRLVANDTGQDEVTGVFLLDLSVRTFEPFSIDRRRQREAIRAASRIATSYYEPNRVGVGQRTEPATIGAEAAASGADWIWLHSMQPSQALDVSNYINDDFRELTQKQQSQASFDGLERIVNALGLVPGRKSIVYFSDGLPLPTDGERMRFQDVIARANSYNVAIYPVDTVGLRVHSQDAANAEALRAAALQDAGSVGSDLGGGAASAVAESIARTGSTSDVFRRLAAQTGGVAIQDTNALVAAIDTIQRDRHHYYLLTYVPARGEADGKWRSIQVTVPGQRVTVRARTGYFSDVSSAGGGHATVDSAAMNALDEASVATTIPVQAAALIFPGASESSVVVMAAVAGADLSIARDPRRNNYQAEFAIVGRILDSSGTVVRQSSQPYRLRGPLSLVVGAQQRTYLYVREPSLAPGAYRLEVAVSDSLGAQSGVKRVDFSVPPRAEGGLEIGDVMLLASRESAARQGTATETVRRGDMLLSPQFGQALDRAVSATLQFYVEVACAAGTTVDSRVEVVRDDKAVLSLPLDLGASDERGHIRRVAHLPLESLAPGEYEGRVTVSQGSQTKTRVFSFGVAR